MFFFFFLRKQVLLETCWSLAASELSTEVSPPRLLGACLSVDVRAETSVVAENQWRTTRDSHSICFLLQRTTDRAQLGRVAGGPPPPAFWGTLCVGLTAGPVLSPLPRKGNGIQQLAHGVVKEPRPSGPCLGDGLVREGPRLLWFSLSFVNEKPHGVVLM